MARCGNQDGELFVEGVQAGAAYKYHIQSALNGHPIEKADPFARQHALPDAFPGDIHGPCSRSGMAGSADAACLTPKPDSVHEVHLGSWK